QAEDGIRDDLVTGVQTCALPICHFPYFSLFTQFHFGLYKGFPRPAPNPGLPTQFQVGIGPAQVNATDNIYGFYVQDTWKLKSNRSEERRVGKEYISRW